MKDFIASFDFKQVDNIVQALIILIFTYFMYKIANKLLNKTKNKESIQFRFLKNLAVVAIWVIGILASLNSFDSMKKITNTIIAGSGIVAIVLGLAAQEPLSNLFSGVFITMFKTYNIGDKIRIVGDDTSGYVEDITLRHTIIRTYTNIRIIIPNSIMGSSKIENITYCTGAAYPIEVTVAYCSSDKIGRALEILEETVKQHPNFYKEKANAVKALCVGFGNSGVNIKVLMWTESVDDNVRACSDCRLKILERFEEEHIEIPYNKVEIINK